MLNDKTAIVTGSTSGIGLAIAEALAAAGANVMLNGLGDAEEIEAVRTQLEQASGRRILYHGANMLNPEEIAALIETFDRSRYNTNATMAENLLFGNSVGDVFKMDRLAENDYVMAVLEKAGLTDTILQAGFQVAAPPTRGR